MDPKYGCLDGTCGGYAYTQSNPSNKTDADGYDDADFGADTGMDSLFAFVGVSPPGAMSGTLPGPGGSKNSVAFLTQDFSWGNTYHLTSTVAGQLQGLLSGFKASPTARWAPGSSTGGALPGMEHFITDVTKVSIALDYGFGNSGITLGTSHIVLNTATWSNLADNQRYFLLGHELTHTIQYARLGTSAFLERYSGEYPAYGVIAGQHAGTLDPIDPKYSLDGIADTAGNDAKSFAP